MKHYLSNIQLGLDPFTASDDPTLEEDIYLEDTTSTILPDEGPASIQTAFVKKPESLSDVNTINHVPTLSSLSP
jgi:hypothetical protein